MENDHHKSPQALVRSLSSASSGSSELAPVRGPVPDEYIMQTNEEATLCKLDAIKLGYWKDPFLPQMLHGSLRHERKTPEMYKGYYARVKCIERLVLGFVEEVYKAKPNGDAVVQIVNLGAGYDTLYWRLRSDGELGKKVKIQVVDVDLLPVTTKKCHAIKTHPALQELLVGTVREGEIAHGELHTDDYHLISSDIRDTLQTERKLLSSCNLDPTCSTLFIAECVLIYMSTDSTNQLFSWIASAFQTVAFINYEQVNMTDNFGQIMYNSLKEQGCVLADADACKSLEFHEERFLKTGWTGAVAADMNQMCRSLSQAELLRIGRLGMIDEPEVLEQLFDHYCIVWAYKDTAGMGLEKLNLV